MKSTFTLKESAKVFLLTLFLLIASIKTFAYDFAIDGICYNIQSKTYGTCNVSGYTELTNNNLIIPASITWNNIKYSVVSIEKEAFKHCSEITSIVIPESVTSIESDAFFKCSGLTSINIPSGITSIEYGTFCGCSALTSINIPKGVTSIKKSAFRGCSKLTSINIPEGVTSIGDQTFYGCSGLTSINIPEGVTYIGDQTFYGCSGLTSINIPEGVTSIGSSAFEGCSGLTSINIPSSINRIEYGAFDKCENLNTAIIEQGGTDIILKDRCFYSIKKLIANRNIKTLRSYSNNNTKDSPFGEKLNIIEFGKRFTRIDDYLFYGCSGLTSVNIPSSVTTIKQNAFDNCENLNTAIIEQGGTDITLEDRCFYPIKKLIANRNIIISSSSKQTPFGPFGPNLNIVKLGGGFNHICDYLFYNCSGLTSINIPENVTSIGRGAFKCCSGLTSINIPKNVTSIREYTFLSCSSLTSINIPEGVTAIENSAFWNCNSLNSISLPNSLKTIGDMEDHFHEGVFFGCSSLQTITIPKNVSLIGPNTFWDCSSLKSIILPNNLSTLGSSAFLGCTALKSIVIPLNVKKIDNYTFYKCCSLEEILLPKNLNTIGGNVFFGCTNLKSIVIPPNVKTIEQYAFAGSNIEDIKIEFGMTKVPDYAFYNCNTLKDIDLPHSVASIGDYAFRRCYSLTSINIPSSVTSVCDSTFEETVTALNIETSKCLRFMPQLKSQIIEITFSDDYEETDVTYFNEWTRLERLISLSETPPMIGDSFSKFQKKNLRVIVPTKALEVYKKTPVWEEFFFLKGGAETTDIENIKQDTNDANITGNHSTYNLNGMKVYNTKPGHIYIRGGKKYVAK